METRVSGMASAEPDGGTERALPRGTSIDRYVVLDVLGAGGMGVVYRAYDPDLDRPLAIKLVRPLVATGLSSGGEDRILREAQALARLSHPNVVSIYDVGTHDGQVFLAMELVEGEDLKVWLGLTDEGRPERSWQDILRVFVAAGRGLAAAHERDLVHRDFKPRNVLIGSDGRVRVVDFGLARLTGRELEAVPDESSERVRLGSDLTGTGGVVGTPAYMPPEQYDGREVDERSDQFSYCVALYQALYRKLPFAADGDDEASYRSNLMEGRVVDADVSTTRVPAWLRAAIVKGLRPDPAERHASMQRLLESFEARLRPRRWLWFGTVGLALGSIIGAAVWAGASRPGVCDGFDQQIGEVWNDGSRARMNSAFESTGLSFASDTWSRVDARLEAWSADWLVARREACEATHEEATQSREILELRATCYDQRLTELAALAKLYESADADVVEKAVEAAGSLTGLETCADLEQLGSGIQPPEDPNVRLAVTDLRGRLAEVDGMRRAGKSEEAAELAEALMEEATRVGYGPVHAEALLLAARTRTKPDEARRFAVQALDVAMRESYVDLQVEAWISLVRIVGYEEAKYELGLEYAAHGRALLDGLPGRAEARARLTQQRATVLDVKGDLAQAKVEYQNAYDQLLAIHGPDHLSLAASLNGLGIVHLLDGQPERALEYFERALELRVRMVGPVHPTVASVHSNMGTVYLRADDCKSAIPKFETALEIVEAALGPDHPDVGTPVNNLGVCYQVEKRYEDARVAFERALALEIQVSGPEHPNTAGLLINLGRLARATEDHELGLSRSQEALDILQKTVGPDHLDTAFAAVGVGSARIKLGQPAAAIEPLELAVRVRAEKDSLPENVAEARFFLAQALWDGDGDRKRARELASEAREGYASLGERGEGLVQAIDAWLAGR